MSKIDENTAFLLSSEKKMKEIVEELY